MEAEFRRTNFFVASDPPMDPPPPVWYGIDWPLSNALCAPGAVGGQAPLVRASTAVGYPPTAVAVELHVARCASRPIGRRSRRTCPRANSGNASQVRRQRRRACSRTASSSSSSLSFSRSTV